MSIEAREEISNHTLLSNNGIPLYRARVAIALIEHSDLEIESEIVKIDSASDLEFLRVVYRPDKLIVEYLSPL